MSHIDSNIPIIYFIQHLLVKQTQHFFDFFQKVCESVSKILWQGGKLKTNPHFDNFI